VIARQKISIKDTCENWCHLSKTQENLILKGGN